MLVVSPGLTQTNFSKNMLEQKAKMQLDHLRGMTSEEVAARDAAGDRTGQHGRDADVQGQAAGAGEPLLPVVRGLVREEEVRELFADEIAERKKKQAEQAAKPQLEVSPPSSR